jgi:hypothetical protein
VAPEAIKSELLGLFLPLGKKIFFEGYYFRKDSGLYPPVMLAQLNRVRIKCQSEIFCLHPGA